MTISKFLMNVAVCAVSIGGVSTSYAASTDGVLEDTTPLKDGTASVESSANRFSAASWSGVRLGQGQDDDTRSMVSTVSAVDADQLRVALRAAWNECKKTGVTAPKIPGATQFELLNAYVAAVVASHNANKAELTGLKEALKAKEAELASLKADVNTRSVTHTESLGKKDNSLMEVVKNNTPLVASVGVAAFALITSVVYSNWSKITSLFS